MCCHSEQQPSPNNVIYQKERICEEIDLRLIKCRNKWLLHMYYPSIFLYPLSVCSWSSSPHTGYQSIQGLGLSTKPFMLSQYIIFLCQILFCLYLQCTLLNIKVILNPKCVVFFNHNALTPCGYNKVAWSLRENKGCGQLVFTVFTTVTQFHSRGKKIRSNLNFILFPQHNSSFHCCL